MCRVTLNWRFMFPGKIWRPDRVIFVIHFDCCIQPIPTTLTAGRQRLPYNTLLNCKTIYNNGQGRNAARHPKGSYKDFFVWEIENWTGLLAQMDTLNSTFHSILG